MECKLNLLCYGLFKAPKIIMILKVFLNIKNDYFLELFFKLKKKSYIFNLKLEMKKMLILIKFKYSYFKLISNYTKYNFQNGL